MILALRIEPRRGSNLGFRFPNPHHAGMEGPNAGDGTEVVRRGSRIRHRRLRLRECSELGTIICGVKVNEARALGSMKFAPPRHFFAGNGMTGKNDSGKAEGVDYGLQIRDQRVQVAGRWRTRRCT